MGRVVSPNDVFYNFSPWDEIRPHDLVHTQNSLLNDPPASYYTLMTLVKSDWRAFHWNPYIAAGIPGFGSAAAACLTPLILLPVLLVPLAWVYTAIIFLKLNLAFLFGYLWLTEERLGRHAAAVGAVVIAGAGIYSVLWLWQITNATVIYPAILWVTARALNGKRTSIALSVLLAVTYVLSGFPAAVAYGAWITAAYALVGLAVVALRRRTRRQIGGVLTPLAAGVAAVVIAVLIALPSLIPFAQFLRRSGYLELRTTMSLNAVFPSSHWRSFVDPERLGNPVEKNWTGDRRLGAMNNYVGATVYVGLLTIPIATLGFFNRRARRRWFWVIAAAVILAAMFGAPVVAPLLATLPGFKYSPLIRVGLLLPLAAGYLAASGVALFRRRAGLVAAVVGVVIAFDLALLAGRFHPYLEPRHAIVPQTPMTKVLRAAAEPFRIAPFFNYLWPNSAELVRVEDIRSHFGSEAAYRRMMQRLDPTSWSGTSTVLMFNSLHYNFTDPLNALLGVRWFIEHKDIDIIKWSVFKATVPGVKETGAVVLRPGAVLERTVDVAEEPFWAIELPLQIEEVRGRDARVEVSLLKGADVVWSRAFTRDDANAMRKVYVPVRPYARSGEQVVLRVRSFGARGSLLKGENSRPGESPLFYGRVTTPIVFDRELPDGRLFRNLAELPRFRAVSNVLKLNDDEFLAARDIDFETETVITDDPVMPPEVEAANARVALTHYAPDEQRIVTESAAPFFLASSEKLTPELRVTVDGRNVRPVEVDMMFAGIPVPAGRHEVVFSRRIARGWWWVAAVGGALWIAALARDVTVARRRG